MSTTQPAGFKLRDHETRSVGVSEIRVESTEKGPGRLVGYAAKFNVRSEPIYGMFREVVKPGAFAKALATGPDIRFLMNHDPSRVLGRTRAGTLRVKEDSIGLRYELDLPDNSFGRDTRVSVERGDMTEMSFHFNKQKDAWGEDENGFALRTLEEVSTKEISLATFPAYPETEASVRSLDPGYAEYEKWNASKNKGRDTEDAKRRLRLLEAKIRE